MVALPGRRSVMKIQWGKHDYEYEATKTTPQLALWGRDSGDKLNRRLIA